TAAPPGSIRRIVVLTLHTAVLKRQQTRKFPTLPIERNWRSGKCRCADPDRKTAHLLKAPLIKRGFSFQLDFWRIEAGDSQADFDYNQSTGTQPDLSG